MVFSSTILGKSGSVTGCSHSSHYKSYGHPSFGGVFNLNRQRVRAQTFVTANLVHGIRCPEKQLKHTQARIISDRPCFQFDCEWPNCDAVFCDIHLLEVGDSVVSVLLDRKGESLASVRSLSLER